MDGSMTGLTPHILFILLFTSNLWAFCGFYVGKTEAALSNRASQIIVVRDGKRTAVSMTNDFKGAFSDFALVVPVPEVLSRDQINITNRALFDRLDSYSAPRLVEYRDPDPCKPIRSYYESKGTESPVEKMRGTRGRTVGVTVEAQYLIGEYDVLILGAKESTGLAAYLQQNGYKVPEKANAVLDSYIKQNMKFFVAKVNLKEQAKSGFSYLRPIQFAFESTKFMLPIRLGMANGDGEQDLILYTITRNGRVESTNYRTARLPSGMDLPLFIKDRFRDFYLAMFQKAHDKENKRVLFTEYAWNMSGCDPCTANPLSQEELRKLGVLWLDEEKAARKKGSAIPAPALPAFLTRLHVRYDREHFPEDIFFQETSDSENFQARYLLRYPWAGEIRCSGAQRYNEEIKNRKDHEALTLASLTGWPLSEVDKLAGLPSDRGKRSEQTGKWYEKIFK